MRPYLFIPGLVVAVVAAVAAQAQTRRAPATPSIDSYRSYLGGDLGLDSLLGSNEHMRRDLAPATPGAVGAPGTGEGDTYGADELLRTSPRGRVSDPTQLYQPRPQLGRPAGPDHRSVYERLREQRERTIRARRQRPQPTTH